MRVCYCYIALRDPHTAREHTNCDLDRAKKEQPKCGKCHSCRSMAAWKEDK